MGSRESDLDKVQSAKFSESHKTQCKEGKVDTCIMCIYIYKLYIRYLLYVAGRNRGKDKFGGQAFKWLSIWSNLIYQDI